MSASLFQLPQLARLALDKAKLARRRGFSSGGKSQLANSGRNTLDGWLAAISFGRQKIFAPATFKGKRRRRRRR